MMRYQVGLVLVALLGGVLLAGTPAHALAGGGAAADGSFGFAARIAVGPARVCTGALVGPQWVLTAASCFDTGTHTVVAGPPPLPTTVTLGRTNLTGSGGRVLSALAVVPHPQRDLALVKLSLRVLDITPIGVATTAPAAGETLQMLGYGRTASEWLPDRLQAAQAAVDAAGPNADAFSWGTAASSQVSACRGDAGGPVFRSNGGQPQLVGINVSAWQAGCLNETDARHGGTAVRVDDLAAWITQNTPGLTTSFAAFWASGAGIGEYDLAQPADRAVPFDFDHSGKLDHLVMYRPGSGIIYIVKHNPDGTFAPVFSSRTGIGGYSLASARDRIVAFDFDHSGRQDHLVLYRPGSGIITIVKHNPNGTFTPVFSSSDGIVGYDLAQPADRVISYDFDHSGKQDHLVLYRPGESVIYIVKHNPNGTFTRVYATGTEGIGEYDLAQPADRVISYDFDHSGRQDHLVMYRPGEGIIYIVKHNPNGTFTPVFSSRDGIVGYDLAQPADRVISYDFDHSGKQDHLVLYRPGEGVIYIVKHNLDGTFTRVYATGTEGIGGYDLAQPEDRIVAYDYDHVGAADHLLLYRPGTGPAWIVGRVPETAPPATPAVQLPGYPGSSIVEDFSYPGAAAIEASINVQLISGDGHILLASCSTAPVDDIGVITVWTSAPIGDNGGGQICFKVTGPTGRLDLNVPGVFEIHGDGQRPGAGHRLTATLTTETGPPTTVVVDPSGSTQVGMGADPDAEPTTLLRLRVPS